MFKPLPLDASLAIQKRQEKFLKNKEQEEKGLSSEQIKEKDEAQRKRVKEIYDHKLKELHEKYPPEQNE